MRPCELVAVLLIEGLSKCPDDPNREQANIFNLAWGWSISFGGGGGWRGNLRYFFNLISFDFDRTSVGTIRL